MTLTPTPEIIVVDDATAMGRIAARRVRRSATMALMARGRWRVALAGGSTPRALYHELGEGAATADRLDWMRTEIFFGDERTVPPDHAESNYRMVREALLSRIAIPAAQVHRMEGEAADLTAAAARYQSELGEPALDLAILGMGPDGHTASLFPGTSALGERQLRCVAVTVPQLGTARLTLTYPVFETAREIVFLIAGQEKALTLKRVIEGPAQPNELPCQAIIRGRATVAIFCDRGAAAELTTISRFPP
jgi:6-phosphogluconolactonase